MDQVAVSSAEPLLEPDVLESPAIKREHVESPELQRVRVVAKDTLEDTPKWIEFMNGSYVNGYWDPTFK